MLLADLREEVVKTARKMRAYGLIELAGGTVCARDRESALVVITPSGLEYEEMRPEDICVLDLRLNLVDGNRRPSVASDMFVAILEARADVGAVMHTHSSWATVFASLGREIPVVTTTHANLVGGPVPVVRPLHPGAHTKEYLANIISTLGQGRAVNLLCHGPVVVGDNLADCFAVAVTVESTASIAIKAAFIGNPLILTPVDTKIAYDYCRKAVGQLKSDSEER